MILDEIVQKRKQQLKKEQAQCSSAQIKQLALRDTRCCYNLYNTLKQPNLAVIAEVKKASPSKGIICADFAPVSVAQQYEQASVNAISILTEEAYFQGNNDYLLQIRRALPTMPLLRKDFIMDPYQLYHAKLLGADAVLLIAALLDTDTLREFYSIANDLGLSCLAEVHNAQELERVLAVGCRIIGINNRDLTTFQVTLQTTATLADQIPNHCVIVAESGIATPDDMRFVHRCGADAVLIGETLMRSQNIADTLAALRTDV